jgi:hypothetical protein
MAKRNHTHRYMLTRGKFRSTWHCTLPDCNHFMPPQWEYLMSSRWSICWSCGQKFGLDDEALTEDQPRCAGCRMNHVDIPVAGLKPFDDLIESSIERAKRQDELMRQQRESQSPKEPDIIEDSGYIPTEDELKELQQESEPPKESVTSSLLDPMTEHEKELMDTRKNPTQYDKPGRKSSDSVKSNE